VAGTKSRLAARSGETLADGSLCRFRGRPCTWPVNRGDWIAAYSVRDHITGWSTSRIAMELCLPSEVWRNVTRLAWLKPC